MRGYCVESSSEGLSSPALMFLVLVTDCDRIRYHHGACSSREWVTYWCVTGLSVYGSRIKMELTRALVPRRSWPPTDQRRGTNVESGRGLRSSVVPLVWSHQRMVSGSS